MEKLYTLSAVELIEKLKNKQNENGLKILKLRKLL